MKKLAYLILVVLWSGFTNQANPTMITVQEKQTGERHTVELLSEGQQNLYIKKELVVETMYFTVNPIISEKEQSTYFLGKEEVVKVTKKNYKRILKNYFQNAPEWRNRIGKMGFRYENIEWLVSSYNRHHASGASSAYSAESLRMDK